MLETQLLAHFKSKYCRMCGTELAQGVSIFGEEGKRLNISEKIRKTLSVLILEEDILPKKICTCCCARLEDFSHYKETVLDAQEKLTTIAKSLLNTPAPGPSRLSKTFQAGRGSGETSKSPFNVVETVACNECGKKFETKNGFETHFELEHPQNPVEVVEAETENENGDVGDRNSDNDESEPLLTPDDTLVTNSQVVVVNSSSTATQPVSTDQASSPETDPLGYECEFCDKIFASSGSYHNHVMSAHKGRKFSCPYCPYSYSQKASLTVHIRTHHSTEEAVGPKTHVCDTCPAKFYEKKSLTRHSKTHTAERLYECHICNKFYKTSKCLAKHVRVHLDANAFVCTTCGKGFCRKSKLEEHENTHSFENGEGCPACHRTFNSHPNYLKHFRRKHAELLIDGTGRVPAPNRKSGATQVVVDARSLLVASQEESVDMTYIHNNSATPLTGQNLSLTPSVNWTDTSTKQSSTMTFHQHMNGLDLVDSAIQSALINEELEQVDEREPVHNSQLRDPLSQQQDHQPNQHHDPNQPMELCYKAPDFQDMPMQLTKVFPQSGPLELCVRNEHEPYQLINVPSSSKENNFGGRIDLIDLSGVTPFQQQPIDLISRTEVCPLNQPHHLNSGVVVQGNSLVDLSLRSTFQEQSTSSFIRELLDLSARSEYHDHQPEQPMELNLSCTRPTPSNHQGNNVNRGHLHSHYHPSSTLQNVVYSDAMFSLQNYTS